ncbi:MAG TPA: hypothetical protein VFF43_13005 [Caldimonas sp.]|nr:hypothetical protein [Caldimonas sp.]
MDLSTARRFRLPGIVSGSGIRHGNFVPALLRRGKREAPEADVI